MLEVHARRAFSLLSNFTACGVAIPENGITQQPLPGFAFHATILPKAVTCMACIRVVGPQLKTVPERA